MNTFTLSGLGRQQFLTKKDYIVSTLKADILSGVKDPGQALTEMEIAKQFSCGQPIVREALIELEHQGFVQRFPHKKTCVTKLGREDVIQIFRLRDELEALAVEWACEKAKDSDIKELRRFVRGMKHGAEDLDLNHFYDSDLAFHRKIWQMSGNKYLVEALERVVVPLFAFFLMKTTRVRESYIESADAHMLIVDGLEMRDAQGLRRLMYESLESWKDDMLNKLHFENE